MKIWVWTGIALLINLCPLVRADSPDPSTPSQPPPTPANHFNNLTGDALAAAIKVYYAQIAEKQAADALKQAQAALQDPVQLAQQVAQLQAENARLKDQLKRAEADRQHSIDVLSERESYWSNRQMASNNSPLASQPSATASIQANDILADFDKDENDAKHKYAVDSVHLAGRIISFVSDSFGNGDASIVLAQSPNHKVAVKFTQHQLGLLPFPGNSASMWGKAKLVHYNPDLKAIVGDFTMNVGTNNASTMRNVILLKEGSPIDMSAQFDGMDGITATAVFNAN